MPIISFNALIHRLCTSLMSIVDTELGGGDGFLSIVRSALASSFVL